MWNSYLELEINEIIMVKVQLQVLTCKRCGHKWVPRKEEVRICPRCKSQYWDLEPKELLQEGGGVKFLRVIGKRKNQDE